VPFDDATPLQVEEVTGQPGFWRLTGPLLYHAKTQDFLVEPPFVTNFASVPRPFTWLVPTSGLYTRAAVVHDFLCRTPGFPRNDADGIFRRAMRELGVPTLRRYVMWGAVRIASGLSGAKLGDVFGIVLLAVLVLPVVLPVALLVLVVLCLLWVAELVVWAVMKALGKSPPGPQQFWWT
jgi:hypothetical protein